MLLDAALRGAAVALLLILAAAFARGDRASTTVRIGIVFAIGLVVQLVSSAPTFEASVPRLWQAPFVGVSVGNAVLFWLFAQALFDDDFVPKAWHGIVWLAIVAVSARNCAVGWHADSLAGTVAIDAQRAAPLVFAALAVFASASTWRADLVERRRRLRVFIVAIGSCYTVGLLALRFASPDGRLDTASATVDAAALTFLVGVAAAAMLRPASSDLIAPLSPSRVDETTPTPVGPARPEPEPRPDPADARLAEALERVMRDEHAYRQEGMTLPALATRLDVPEYRLRRVINRHLGHRNFNAFINAYRLDEARVALADPARRTLPVLTIALTAGFQSIGPFNRAFKIATGVTPTEFRQRHRADS